MQPHNVRKRVRKPLMEEIAARWAGWQRSAFSRYTHLLEGDEAPALDVTALAAASPSLEETLARRAELTT